MFAHWHEYFLLIGTAAGALIGLLFVVATLSASMETDQAQDGIRVYTTPTVLHFGIVLAASALCLAPELSLHIFAGLMIGLALVGLGNSLFVVRAIGLRTIMQPAHWSDVWCYGVAPSVIYVVLGVLAAPVWSRLSWAPDGLALAILALMSLAIRNAWDLVSWIAPRINP